jgi:superfamily II DNA or RNA helicase
MKATLKIQDFNIGGVNDACFIAVNQTASTQEFIRIFDGIREDSLLIIADEVHYLGSKKLRNVLNIKAGFRIGLSATPDRWFDADGTDCINQYFKGTCFELPLSEAIGKYLTPYEYQPVVVHLSDSEAQKYESLTQKIRKMWLYSSAREDLDENENLKNALIERSRVIAGAAEKLEQLKKHLLSEIALEKANGNVLKNTLAHLSHYAANSCVDDSLAGP